MSIAQSHPNGSAERAEINLDSLDVGSRIEVEFGDWNGTGYSFNNVEATRKFIVVEADEEQIVVVDMDDRLQWNTQSTDHEGYEVTLQEDGSVSGFEVLDWNTVVKTITQYTKPTPHMVKEGRLGRSNH